MTPAAGLALFGIAIFIADRILRQYDYHEIAAAVVAVPWWTVGAAGMLTVLGYAALIACDYVALRILGRRIAWRRVIVPSFVSFAVSNSAPASVVTAGGVRYRLYRPAGISIADATVIAGTNVITYAIGLCGLSGLLLALGEHPAVPVLATAGRGLGIVLLAVPVLYVALAGTARPGLHIGPMLIRLPGRRLALAQLGVSVADWLLSSGALFVLLLSTAPLDYGAFLTTFLIAQIAALFLPIPGGLGVFEAVILLLRPGSVAAPAALAALLVYRVVYYLLPLLLAGFVLIAGWLAEVRRAPEPWKAAGARLAAIAPRLMAWTTFLAGMLLTLSGAIPTGDRRLRFLGEVLPLGMIEASHFLGSVVGAVLIVLAWGIERRVRLAYQVVSVLFAAGVLLALARSLDYGIAATLLVGNVIVVVAGRSFPRSATRSTTPMEPLWQYAIGIVVVSLLFVTIWLYRHAGLGSDVWWHFALFGQASRSLRAMLGAGVVFLVFLVAHALARRAPPPRAPRRRRGGSHPHHERPRRRQGLRAGAPDLPGE